MDSSQVADDEQRNRWVQGVLQNRKPPVYIEDWCGERVLALNARIEQEQILTRNARELLGHEALENATLRAIIKRCVPWLKLERNHAALGNDQLARLVALLTDINDFTGSGGAANRKAAVLSSKEGPVLMPPPEPVLLPPSEPTLIIGPEGVTVVK